MCQACGEATSVHGQVKRVVWVGSRVPTAVEDEAMAECYGKAAGTVITASDSSNLEREIARHQGEDTVVFMSDLEPLLIMKLRDAGLNFNVIGVEETRGGLGFVVWLQPVISHYQGSLFKRCQTTPRFRLAWPWPDSS